MRVRLNDLQDAFEFVSASEEHQAFLCKPATTWTFCRRTSTTAKNTSPS